MLILDTDHASLLEWEHGEEYEQLRKRLDQSSDEAAGTAGWIDRDQAWARGRAQATNQKTAEKWKPLPAITKRCQIPWK